jgi:hypothetical protein
MAKAVFPVDRLFPGAASAGSPAETQDRIVQRFLRAIGANGRSADR